MPNISVIVPVYKVEKYIHRCVDSILGQTYADFELILVDDGSPDSCGAICDEYAAKDRRVIVIHQKNGGLSAARNAGIDWAFSHSNSEWFTFIDSDDWVHNEYLQRLLDAALAYNSDVSICGYAETNGQDPEIHSEYLNPVIWKTEQFFVEHNVNATIAWGKLYKKTCFETIRYPVGKIHEDEYVTYRILFQYEKVSFVPATLYAYFINNEGITKKPWSPERLDMINAFNSQLLFFKEYGYINAYNVKIISYFLELSNLLGHFSFISLSGISNRIKLQKKRMQLFFQMTPSQRAHVCNELYPRISEAYWTIFAGIQMLLRGEWKILIQKVKNKLKK